MTAQQEGFRIVARAAGRTPGTQAAALDHALRIGAELDHVDYTRTHRNETWVGDETTGTRWIEIEEELRRANYASKKKGVRKFDGKKAFRRFVQLGVGVPWRHNGSGEGPLREVIVSLGADAFTPAPGTPEQHITRFIDVQEGKPRAWDDRKVRRFKTAVEGFAKETFGDMLVAAVWHADEDSPHAHLFLAAIERHEPTPKSRFVDGETILRTRQHPAIESYERFQDMAGAYFARPEHASMRIVRGERRAAAGREAWRRGEDAWNALGAEEKAAMPGGSKRAKRLHALRLEAEKARADAAKKGGSMRSDAAEKLAVKMLEAAGFVSSKDVHEHHTRRKRKVLLARYSDLVTAEDMSGDIKAVQHRIMTAAVERLEKVRAEVEAEEKRGSEAATRADVEERRGHDAAQERHRADTRAARRRAAEDECAAIDRARRAAEIDDRSLVAERDESHLRGRLEAIDLGVRMAADGDLYWSLEHGEARVRRGDTTPAERDALRTRLGPGVGDLEGVLVRDAEARAAHAAQRAELDDDAERLAGRAAELEDARQCVRVDERDARRRAAHLAELAERAGGIVAAIDPELAAEMQIVVDAREQDVPLEDLYPDAMPLQATYTREDGMKLQHRVAEMPNSELGRRHRATVSWITVLDETSEAGDREALERGAKALERVAARRGYDLEAGVHRPKTATDPALARAHTDQEATPIQLRAVRQYVRAR